MLRQAECLPQVNCVNRRQSKGKNETINEGRIDSFSWQSIATAAIIPAGKDSFTRTEKKKNLISVVFPLLFPIIPQDDVQDYSKGTPKTSQKIKNG